MLGHGHVTAHLLLKASHQGFALTGWRKFTGIPSECGGMNWFVSILTMQIRLPVQKRDSGEPLILGSRRNRMSLRVHRTMFTFSDSQLKMWHSDEFRRSLKVKSSPDGLRVATRSHNPPAFCPAAVSSQNAPLMAKPRVFSEDLSYFGLADIRLVWFWTCHCLRSLKNWHRGHSLRRLHKCTDTHLTNTRGQKSRSTLSSSRRLTKQICVRVLIFVRHCSSSL